MLLTLSQEDGFALTKFWHAKTHDQPSGVDGASRLQICYSFLTSKVDTNSVVLLDRPRPTVTKLRAQLRWCLLRPEAYPDVLLRREHQTWHLHCHEKLASQKRRPSQRSTLTNIHDQPSGAC
jgi:hypothetical protein